MDYVKLYYKMLERNKKHEQEIDLLRSTLQHTIDVAETYKAESDSLRKDAERYKTLAAYLVSTDTTFDDAIVACNNVGEMSAVIDSMKD